MMYRDYDIYANGELVGGVGVRLGAGQFREPKDHAPGGHSGAGGHGGEELCKTRTLNKLRAPKDLKLLERRKMHYSDTDVNGHVKQHPLRRLRLRRGGAGQAAGRPVLDRDADRLPGRVPPGGGAGS